MKVVRPFDPAALAAGQPGDWLLAPEEGEGVAVRIRRGGAQPAPGVRNDVERFALVIEGTVVLAAGEVRSTAGVGELAFIPQGVSGAVSGDAGSVWAEIEAVVEDIAQPDPTSSGKVIPVDHSRFEGGGFAYQSFIDRSVGATTMRINLLQVQPGSGSPDWHIHRFAQIYLIQEGAMTLDVGRHRYVAGANSLVVLPAGVVHRNFNATESIERHISLLVPEPEVEEIFDYAVTIHEHEAEVLTSVPV